MLSYRVLTFQICYNSKCGIIARNKRTNKQTLYATGYQIYFLFNKVRA